MISDDLLLSSLHRKHETFVSALLFVTKAVVIFALGVLWRTTLGPQLMSLYIWRIPNQELVRSNPADISLWRIAAQVLMMDILYVAVPLVLLALVLAFTSARKYLSRNLTIFATLALALCLLGFPFVFDLIWLYLSNIFLGTEHVLRIVWYMHRTGTFVFALGLTLYYILRVSVRSDFLDAYNSTELRDDDRRALTLQRHRNDILATERKTVHDYKKNMSFLRRAIIRWMFIPEADQLHELYSYYREPLLLLKLAKSNSSGSKTRQAAGHSISERHSLEPKSFGITMPETFDISRIERDLLRYRFEQGALTAYVQGLLDRFKSRDQRKSIMELFENLDLAVTYLGKIYAAREAEGRLSLVDLDLEFQRKEMEHKIVRKTADIAEEERRIRQAQRPDQEPVAMIQSDPDQEMRDELAQVERLEQHRMNIQRIRENIKDGYQQQKARQIMDELNSHIEEHADDKERIQNNPNLSDSARKEALRTSELAFVRRLDDFKRRYDLS